MTRIKRQKFFSRRKITLTSVSMLAITSLIIVGVTLLLTYSLFINEKIRDSEAAAQTFVSVMEDFFRTHKMEPGLKAKLRYIQNYTRILKDNEEFIFAYRQNKKEYYIVHRAEGKFSGARILPKAEEWSNFLRKALYDNKSGNLSVRDHRGKMVIGAYAPIPSIGVALTVKNDLWPIQKRFLFAGAQILLVALVFILVGAVMAYVYEKRIFQKMEREEGNLRRAMEDLEMLKKAIDEHMIVSIADSRGWIREVNKKFCEATGFEKYEVTNSAFSDLIYGSPTETYYRQLWDTISEGNIWQGRVKTKKKSGEYFWSDTAIVPVSSPHRDGKYFICLQLDVTKKLEADAEILKAKQAAESASEQKGRFLAHMSHEIRTPLSVIVGFIDLLEEKKQNPKTHESYLQSIKKKCQTFAKSS